MVYIILLLFILQGSQSCSCVDCSLSCISKEFEALGQVFSICGLNGYGFIVSIVLLCIGLSSTLYLYFRNRNCPVQESQGKWFK